VSNSLLQQYWRDKAKLEASGDLPENFRELLRRAASLYGQQTAINFFDQGRQLSFVETQDQAYQLAGQLAEQGVGKGTHVAVMMSNRIEFPVTWLALAVLGAVMVPVNTRYTAAELDYQLNDADVEFLVVDADLLPAFEAMSQRPLQLTDERVIVFDENSLTSPYAHWQTLMDRGDKHYRPAWNISGEDLMNIQYTSGSTGFPKGCMQLQKYWIVMGCTVAQCSDSIKNILSDHPFFYMDPQWLLVMGLFSGATVHYAEKLSIKKFVQRVKDHKVELSLFPRPMVGETGQVSDQQTHLKKLFAVAAGADGVRNVERRFQCLVRDGYGMTEIGLGLCLPDDIEDERAYGSCGVPTPHRQCKIWREDGTEAAQGEIGELLVSGNGVFEGYYNDPQATEGAFVDGWFRTGDLFLKDQFGYYRMVGRVKDMIRRSSENISALEVEQALTMVPGVQQAAAIAVPDDYRGEEVKAYVLLEEGQTAATVPPQKIIEVCRKQLAEFKLPRFVEYVSQFPYTPTQKVAKQELKKAKDDLRQGSWDQLGGEWLG